MKLLMIIIAALLLDANAQPAFGQSIGIEILNDSVHVSPTEGKITLVIRCRNFTDQNLLLYGLKSELNRFATIERICDLDRVGASVALFIFDENNEVQRPEWSIGDIDYKPMPIESLEASMKSKSIQYSNEMRVIKANDIIEFERIIDLNDFKLKNGWYHLQLGYYSGKGVKQAIVGEAQVDYDKKVHKAVLYQGCAISNKITFLFD